MLGQIDGPTAKKTEIYGHREWRKRVYISLSHLYVFMDNKWSFNIAVNQGFFGEKNIVFSSGCDFDQKDRIVDRVKNMLGIYFVILNKMDEKSIG